MNKQHLSLIDQRYLFSKKFNMSKIHPIFFILLIGILFRLFGINWDQNFHLHPDERAIILFTLPLHFPSSIHEFFQTTSPLNPHFFAYGNFPLYLLKASAQILSYFNLDLKTYNGIQLIGRGISILADLGTILLVFLVAKQLKNNLVGILGALFYCLSVLPIQAAHFYAVDILLTFFIFLSLFQLLKFYKNPTRKNAFLLGIFFGFSLATKMSALPLAVAVSVTLCIDFFLIFISSPHKPHIWWPHVPKLIKKLIGEGIIILLSTFTTFIVFEPYALIDHVEFFRQNLQQYQMTHDAFTFPYTLQYVGITPYIYELRNIFFWGQGPMLGTASFMGFFYFLFLLTKIKNKNWPQEILFISFFIVYFLIVGKFAVGWMRYMLPLYPFLSIFAALLITQLIHLFLKPFRNMLIVCFLLLIFIWPLSFLYIYSQPNARALASQWINDKIPAGKSLAIEHWDDSLPLYGQEKYQMITLKLYEPDSKEKWTEISQQLQQSDYILIASNRLYTPLQKLTDCKHLPLFHCYTQTAKYYQKLFGEKLGFRKVAEFSISPTIPLINIAIDDQSADESFTVYDHPKIMIFKKENNLIGDLNNTLK